MELVRFVASTLRRVGGVAEPREADVVEALLPAPVAAALEIPEEARLRLRSEPAPKEVPAGYGSTPLSRICALAEEGARLHRLELHAALPKRERVVREAEAALSFRNAVARVESLDESILEYLVFDFRYAALSEETDEGLVSVALEAKGGSSPALAPSVSRELAENPESRRPWSGPRDSRVGKAEFFAARRAALALALQETRPLVDRLERRCARDARRIEEYYDALREEVERRRGREGESPEKLTGKLRAVEGERRHKRDGLRQRYTVTLRVEPLGVLAVRMPGLRLRVRLQRRKRSRSASLAWNPLVREFDRWLCAACGSEAAGPALCDELHLLCRACPPECPGCGRPACPACRPRSCACGRRRGEGRSDA